MTYSMIQYQYKGDTAYLCACLALSELWEGTEQTPENDGGTLDALLRVTSWTEADAMRALDSYALALAIGHISAQADSRQNFAAFSSKVTVSATARNRHIVEPLRESRN